MKQSHLAENAIKPRLFTPSYCCILAANFLLFFGFWMLVPLLPFYLKENFGVGESAIGAILACYTVSALMVRPFSGYLLDSFSRKPLYIIAYALFTSLFFGYIIGGTLTFFYSITHFARLYVWSCYCRRQYGSSRHYAL